MKPLIVILSIFIAQVTHAQTFSFEEVWTSIKKNSPVLSKEEHTLHAHELAVSRQQYHWLPSLSLGASAFSTNDPGANFFSTLSQRQINALDFNPNSLNQPGFHTFETATIGLDLPLYEGGRKSAELEAASKIRDAQDFQRSAVTLNEYVDTAINYVRLSSLSIARERLISLSEQVGKVISNYSIGQSSNPVGYSGLLGLKSLKNRLAYEILSIRSKESISKIILTEKMNLKSNDWKVQSENVNRFLERTASFMQETSSPSFAESALLARADAFESMKTAESSRFLPRLGLFANESLTHGSRDLGAGFTGGVYLQWSLFHPDHLNRVSEKEELFKASSSEAEVATQSNAIEKITMLQTEETLNQSLILILESETLLSEQVKVASRLFQSGAISALQFAEVLNRRVDLILNLLSTEQSLIEIRGKRMKLSRVGVK